MPKLRHDSSAARGMGDFARPESQPAPPPDTPPVPRTHHPRSRLNDLLGFAKREIEDAEEELTEREFANYCAILIIHLTAKHIEENE